MFISPRTAQCWRRTFPAVGWDAKEARRTLEGGAWFYQRVDFSDGSLCLFQFDYSVLYGNEALRGVLPDFELASLVLLAVVLVTTVTLISRVNDNRVKFVVGT